MKVKFEFEDQDNWRDFANGPDYRIAIESSLNIIRNYRKHNNPSEMMLKGLEYAEQVIYEELTERGLDVF